MASLTVVELKSFIIGRGGKVPTGNKEACVVVAEAVREQQPVVAVVAASEEVTELRAQVAAAAAAAAAAEEEISSGTPLYSAYMMHTLLTFMIFHSFLYPKIVCDI